MNCHRAVKVTNIETRCEYKFEYRAIKVPGGGMFEEREHRLTNVETGEEISVRDYNEQLGKYEISEAKKGRNLADLDRQAATSQSWSSFNPERNGRVQIISYENDMNSILAQLPEEKHDDFYSKYHSFVSKILASQSRIASAAVTGPAKFNTRRNEKANNAYEGNVRELNAWKEKYLKRALREIEAAKPEEQKQAEEWELLRKEIDRSVESIIEVDNGSPYYRSAFVNSIYGKVATCAANGKRKIVENALEYVRQWNERMTKPVFTNRHKFWKLLEECDKAIEKQVDKENMENREKEINGVTVVKNFEEDRLQLIYDGKPSPDVIAKLKSAAFRWSPRFGAWQRQLTTNALYSASRVLGCEVNDLRSI